MAVPGTEQTIRGVPALDLLVIDEASRVTDDLMVAVMPMIATTGGTIMALSVPRLARKAGSSRRRPRLPPGAAAGRTGRSPRTCVRGSPRTTWTRCLIKWARRYSSRSTSAGFLLGDRQVFSVGAIDSIVAGAEEREEALGWKL